MVCDYEYPDNRTDFKILAAKCLLEKLEPIENKAGGPGHFKTQMLVDCLLAELIGAKDSLLHEINRELKLKLPNKEVTKFDTKQQKLKIQEGLEKKGHYIGILKELPELYTKGRWLYQLRQYRNFSIHQDIIPRHIVQTIPPSTTVYFRNQDLEEPQSGRGPEIVSYFKDTIEKMHTLIKAVRKEIRRITP